MGVRMTSFDIDIERFIWIFTFGFGAVVSFLRPREFDAVWFLDDQNIRVLPYHGDGSEVRHEIHPMCLDVNVLLYRMACHRYI